VKKTFVIVIALLFAVVLMTPAMAQDKSPAAAGVTPAAKGPAPKASPGVSTADAPAPQAGPGGAPKVGESLGKKTMKYAGEVSKVDAAMVTVKGKKDEKTFDVSKAKFKGYKDAAEIKAGDKVAVAYTKAGDKLMADGFAKAGAKVKKEAPAKGTADAPAPGTGPAGAPKVGDPTPKK
jgi:hypothetical protein